MIVIPMLGRSSRFMNAGYSIPKYQLPLGNETVFSKSVKSFENYFNGMPFLFIVRKDHNAMEFVSQEVVRMGLKDFRIIELSTETRGQAESVEIGTRDYAANTAILIFNIDTIRLNFVMPEDNILGDGFLEVFEGVGDGWSFIEPGDENSVIRTTEKFRISDLCSNGLYYFKQLSQFRSAFYSSISDKNALNGEIYVAPLYNLLIKEGLDIKYRLVPSKEILHCGIPLDYESLKSKLG